jgi:hypothetical protein
MKLRKKTIAIEQAVKLKTRDGRTTIATITINLKGRMDQDEGKIVKPRN